MNLIKYPRTSHLPWSPGATSDDKTLHSTQHFEGFEVVVTEKMDGENSTLYSHYMHARSLESRHHPSRNWLKAFHSSFAHLIPENWRLCGENLFAQHSIKYDSLESYFYLFLIWNEKNQALCFEQTCELAQKWGLKMPPILYQGLWDQKKMEKLHLDLNLTQQEGFVVRKAHAFDFADFSLNMAKWVRSNHVQTQDHWQYSQIIPNQLKSSK